MDRERAREEIKPRLAEYIERHATNRGKGFYNCPFCGSGEGMNNNYTAALKVTGEMWHCFSCNRGGDIFNFVADLLQLDPRADFAKILDVAAAELGYSMDGETTTTTTAPPRAKVTPPPPPPEARADYSAFINACIDAIGETDYPARRGLTADTVARFRLGYSAERQQIIIPYSKQNSYYISRSVHIDANGKGAGKWYKPPTAEAGKEPIYNAAELDRETTAPLFITEAPLDAISIMQEGGAAIAIGGTGADKLRKALETRPRFNRPFIIATDSDGAGTGAAAALEDIAVAHGIIFTRFIYPDGIKDANAFLMADREGLKNAVENSIEKINKAREKLEKAAEVAEKTAWEAEKRATSATAHLQSFFAELANNTAKPAIPTGFSNLDYKLDGGLYAGLYIIGAVSSLGKTTFLLQIADQIAKAGQDVIVFTLEMGGAELVAKSLSRETFRQRPMLAKSVRELTSPTMRKEWGESDFNIVADAATEYDKAARRIRIIENSGDMNIDEIRRITEQHATKEGRAPVVVVDYLQILAPAVPGATDKQNTDKAVLALKHISRDLRTPVLAISSFNRDNYTDPVNMTAFKESGAIEYSSDVLIGLQYAGMDYKPGETDANRKTRLLTDAETRNEKAAAGKPVDIELKILKNRNGSRGDLCFKYWPKYNYYEPSLKADQNDRPIDL